MSYIEKEKLIKADIVSIENRVRHAFNQGYDLGFKVGKEKAKPQEPQTFKWCTDCREYDQEKHCCHRWSKAIRNTVEEMKQEYIERNVLDKIRAEIEQKCCITVGRENDPAITLYDVLQIMDKFEEESEDKE